MLHTRTESPWPLPWAAPRALPTISPPSEFDRRRVHIGHVEMCPAGHTGAPDHHRVRATINLGGLAPADVVVQLLPGAAAGSDDWQVDAIARLWSVQSLSNGSFVFEACVPTALIAAPRRVTLCIGPATDGEHMPVLQPVGRRQTLPPYRARAD